MTQREALKTALQILLSGRSLDAETAKEIGLIDEITEGDAVVRATELARAFILGADGKALQTAFERRQQATTSWESSRPFPEDLLQDPEIQTLIGALKHSGREKAVEKILHALRTGFEQGFSKGIETEAKLFASAVVAPDEGKAGIEAFLHKQSKPLPPQPLRKKISPEEEKALLASGDLLPIDAPFFPGVTKIPKYQYALAVVRDEKTGAIPHGDPV
ncbi:MAG: acetyl-CoA synthetase, partial [Chloroherpetonaceae bacterium]|nr:acetyl-CoA synthetase [Chloroherpetonaceae bacterium]